jgi:hypothetical protein
MPQFLFTYHGGHTPDSPEETQKVMAEWGAWFGGMGDALAVPGAPVGGSSTVSASGVADGGGANPVSGYSVVNADNMDGATAMAKGCPMVKNGSGSVQVSEVIEM